MQKFNHREIGLLVTSSNEIEIGPIIKQTSSLINALTNFSVCLIPSGHVYECAMFTYVHVLVLVRNQFVIRHSSVSTIYTWHVYTVRRGHDPCDMYCPSGHLLISNWKLNYVTHQSYKRVEHLFSQLEYKL